MTKKIINPEVGDINPAPPKKSPAKKPKETAVVLKKSGMGLISGLTTKDLKNALDVITEQRKVIKKFIDENLENGTDYGKIHVVSYDKCPAQAKCTNKGHFSKAVLFKPGQEKLFSIFQITAELERDDETIDMLSNVQNLVAFKCVMYRNGKRIGEGRGSAVVGDKKRDANATIKIAEKRARMDACLSLGFSEFFAQDLDDPDYKTGSDMANKRAADEAEARELKQPATNAERGQLLKEFTKLGYYTQEDQIEILHMIGIEKPKEMTSGQIRAVIKVFQDGDVPEKPPEHPDAVTDNVPETEEEIAEGMDEAIGNMTPDPILITPSIIEDIQERLASIGLTAMGKMNLLKTTIDKLNFKNLTDAQWMALDKRITAVLNQEEQLPDDWFSKGQRSLVDFSEPSNKA